MPTDPEAFYAVDRVEGSRAVLISDTGEEIVVPLSQLPHGVLEGLVLRVRKDDEENPRWQSALIDEIETRQRRKDAEDLLKELRRRDPGGGITL